MQERTDTIPAKGLHRMADRRYFSLDIPSCSGTKPLISGTNAHLAWERDHPQDETDAMLVGSYLHARLLQPAEVAKQFVVCPKVDRRTKEGKAQWAAMEIDAEKRGASLIAEKDAELAESMAAAALSHKGVAHLLYSCVEREIVAIGEIAGRPAKCKIDGILASKNGGREVCVLDVKSTVSASNRDFGRSVISFGYAHQAAFYARVLDSIGLRCEDFVFIAIEKERPHCVAVYRLPEVAVSVADHHIDRLVERWWKVKAGDRTGYPEEIQDLVLPGWWLRGGYGDE
jgi:hypothetical protein